MVRHSGIYPHPQPNGALGPYRYLSTILVRPCDVHLFPPALYHLRKGHATIYGEYGHDISLSESSTLIEYQGIVLLLCQRYVILELPAPSYLRTHPFTQFLCATDLARYVSAPRSERKVSHPTLPLVDRRFRWIIGFVVSPFAP